LVTVVPVGSRAKISAGPAVVGAGCWAKAAVLTEIAIMAADMIGFMIASYRRILVMA